MTNENIYTQLDQLSEVAVNLDRENQRLYYELDKLQLETREQQQLIDQLCKKNADLESMLSLRELFMKIMAAPSDGEYAQTGFEELRQQMVQNSQENQRLQQQVDRLSDLYKLVCEENKDLLEELNADKPLEQEASDTADSYVEDRILDNPPEVQVAALKAQIHIWKAFAEQRSAKLRSVIKENAELRKKNAKFQEEYNTETKKQKEQEQ